MMRLAMILLMVVTVNAADWPTYHGDASLSGVSKDELPSDPELRWRFNAGGAVYSPPVSDGELIFFTAKKGRVFALDMDGSNLWNRAFSHKNDAGQERAERFDAPLVFSKDVLVAGSVRGMVYAMEASTGKPMWCYASDGIIAGSPNVLDDQVILLDQSEGALHVLELQTGKLLWKSEAIERCDGVPGIGKNHIVFGSCLAAFHVFSRAGKHLYDIEVGGDGQIAGGVAVVGDHAYGGTRDGRMLCVDLNAGEIVWSSDESEEQTFSTPAVTEKFVVYSSDNGFVYAVNRTDGSLVWKEDTEGIPYSPVVAGDKVAVASDGRLLLLKLADGSRLWTREISDDVSSPALINQMLVVGADDGTLSAWGKK